MHPSPIPQPWPYPRWIAHRGAGKLAPENTLAAFRLGAAFGYRMFECDVKLSADGVPFLLHDATLARTVAAHAGTAPADLAGTHPWERLSRMDAGSWHSRTYAGEPMPSLEAIAAFCIANHYCINLEIKPTPGEEERTGAVVANAVAQLWAGQTVMPLLTSFEIPALRAAQLAQPQLPRGLLLDSMRADWLDIAASMQCQAVICNYRLWNANTVAAAQAAGLRTLSYTVNDADVAAQLIDWGTDGLITDRVDFFSPA